MTPKRVFAKLHVLATFVHQGEPLVTTAEWLPGRQRWKYETWDSLHAELGAVWRDGVDQPDPDYAKMVEEDAR